MLQSPLEHSILKRARQAGLLDVNLIDIRAFTTDRHRTVDDAPYGGGAGMVMKPEPIFRAVEALTAYPDFGLAISDFGLDNASGENPKSKIRDPKSTGPGRIILMTPQGEPFTQARARELSLEEHLVLICGRYEGIDERVREHLVTDELSIGDYVLTGGELAALVVLDAVARLIPGVLGDEESSQQDTFTDDLLEYPHYTRPADFRGWSIPEVLLSGNHEEVARWRRRQSLLRTLVRRPDLFRQHKLTEEELILLGLERPRRRRRRSPHRETEKEPEDES
jgi:tRNA (guanine37-N1)-methyltransferase